MIERPREFNIEMGQEIDKEIVNLADDLEKTLIDLRQCENDLAQTRQGAEDLKTSLLQMIDLSKEVDDMEEAQRYMEQLINIEKQQQAYISEIEDIVTDFKSVYTSQLAIFEKLKALKRGLDHGSSGTAH